MLEDSLRELFAAQVEQPPAMLDAADDAIRLLTPGPGGRAGR